MAMTLTLAGCGSTGGSGDVTLKLVAADYGDKPVNSSQKYWGELARAFEAKNPGIHIDVSVYKWTDVDRKVREMDKRGDAPDMAQIGAYADYVDEDKLYSADELLSIPVQADFLPGLSKVGEVNRVQYGMPFVASARLLFYNKKLFSEAGLTPPKSWDDIEKDAVKLKSMGVKYPYALPLGKEEAQAESMMWMLGGGGGYTDNVGNYTIDSPENIRTFEWLRDNLVGKGLTGTDPAKMDRQEAFDAFSLEQVGMLNGHTTFMQQADSRAVEYGMVPLPGEMGRSKTSMGVTDWMMAFKKKGHRDEIGKFLNFAYSKKNVLSFAEQYDLLPVTTSASDAMRADKKEKDLWPFLDQLDTAAFYPSDKTSWATVSGEMKSKIGTAVQKGGNPASVLTEIAREADALENSRK